MPTQDMHHHVACIIVHIIVYDMTRHRSCIITIQSRLFTHFCTYHFAQTIVHHFTYTTATSFLGITNIFAYYFKNCSSSISLYKLSEYTISEHTYLHCKHYTIVYCIHHCLDSIVRIIIRQISSLLYCLQMLTPHCMYVFHHKVEVYMSYLVHVKIM